MILYTPPIKLIGLKFFSYSAPYFLGISAVKVALKISQTFHSDGNFELFASNHLSRLPNRP